MKPFQKLSPSLRASANRISSSFAEIMDRDPATWRDDQRQTVVQTLTNIHADATGRQMSDSEQQLWTAAKSAVDVHDNTIVRSFTRDSNGNAVELGREDRRAEHDPFGSTPSAGAWRTSDGRDVRVYSRDERLATGQHEYAGASFGGVVRSAITGPRTEGERRALSEGSSSAGGVSVPAVLSREFIDLLRANQVCVRAGARTVAMDSQTLKIARLDGDVPAAWRSENASISTGDPTFSGVTLTAQSLAGMIVVSRELLQDSINVDAMIAQAFAEKFAVMLDAACLVGSGTPPEPRGLMNISGLAQVSMGTNGAAVDSYDELMDLRLALDNNNAPASSAWIMAPRSFRTLAGITDTNGAWKSPPQYLYSNSWVGGSLLDKQSANNPPWLVTTGIPTNQVQGSSSAASSVFTGDFSEMLLGFREAVHIEVVPQAYASSGQVAIIAHLRADMALARPSAFGRLVGIIP